MLHVVGGNMQSFWKKMEISQKKIELPYNPIISLRGVDSKETKSGSQRDICIPWFNAASFTVAKISTSTEVPINEEVDEKV